MATTNLVQPSSTNAAKERRLTMVTTTSLGDTRVRHLLTSEIPEDREFAKLAIESVDGLVGRLRPILPYVSKEQGNTRGISVFGVRCLMLRHDGVWCNMPLIGEAEEKPDAWQDYSLFEVLTGLELVLQEASHKRRQHLAAIDAATGAIHEVNARVHSLAGKKMPESV